MTLNGQDDPPGHQQREHQLERTLIATNRDLGGSMFLFATG